MSKITNSMYIQCTLTVYLEFVLTHTLQFSIQQVASDPTHNIFDYEYEPVTNESNKTGPKLLVYCQSDVH